MDWNIPQISGQPLQVVLGFGDRIFVVGANGAGKSALIQQFVSSNPNRKVRRISAHRQTWFNSGSIDLTPQNRREFDQQFVQQEMNVQARWRDFNAQQKQSAVLFDLVSRENARSRSIARHVDDQDTQKAIQFASESVSPFDQLNELLALGTLSVSLENSNDEEILAQHRNDGTSFSIAQMSDGERNAAIIAATVLTVESETVLLIDEPERHLHRSIIEPFLSALFQRRQDCAFIISTHEIALPAANPEARVLMVRSCEWNGDTAKAWDVEILEANTNLPAEFRRDILGARRRILFVEGTTTGLDLPLYDALFPCLSVVPKGSCSDVQRAVSGLRSARDLHHVEALGLIDKDDRSASEIVHLAKNGIFALDVRSVEALYYCSDAIAAVAGRQAESLGSNDDELIELAKTKALDVLKQSGLAERMAARRCERTVRNSMLSQLPNWKKLIKTDATTRIGACIGSPYPEELKCFKKLVVDEHLDDLVARYPLRESGVFGAIAEALRCSERRDYEQMVVSQIRRDSDLAQKLRERIAPLSTALEAEPTVPENTGS